MKTTTTLDSVYKKGLLWGDENHRHFFLWVSWWVDSMVMASLFIEKAKKEWISEKNITLLHYNHKQRVDSWNDALLIKNIFPSFNLIVWTYWWPGKTESLLREARYNFFVRQMESKGRWGDILILWHHLDDRIETTLMNLQKWCRIQGILNMRELQPLWKDDRFEVYRPLLNVYKSELIDYAKKNKVQYIIDETNNDPLYTRRNSIRKEISFSKENYDIIRSMYNHLELYRDNKLWEIDLKKIKKEYIDWYTGYEINNLTQNDIIFLLERLWFVWISTWFLQEFYRFNFLSSWLIYFRWTAFMRSLNKLYRFNTNNCFRIVKETDIVTLWQNKERYIRKWDKFWWKRISKILIKKKIPLFLRKLTKVSEIDWVITGYKTINPEDILED